MTVGERIREQREKIGMSQVEFADRINASKQTLYKYENNLITNIPSDKIEAAAKLCHVSPATLMGWEDAHNTQVGIQTGKGIVINVLGRVAAGIPTRAVIIVQAPVFSAWDTARAFITSLSLFPSESW